MPENFSISEVTEPDEFLALKDEWNDLVEHDECATVFQTWEFQYHAWRIYADTVSLHILLVRDGSGNLIGCAPLSEKRWHLWPLSMRIMEFASSNYCDYSNFILRKNHVQAALYALAIWLQNNIHRWDVVRLQAVREDSLLLQESLFLSKIGRHFDVKARSAAPFLRFKAGWKTYESALNKKRAKSLRYEVRNLFRKFEGQFEQANKGEGLNQAMDQLIELHQKRMHEKQQMGAFASRRARNEFKELVRKLSERGISKVHSISSSEQTIASVVTFEFRDTVSYFQVGFDPHYQRLSPGKVLQALRINEALQNGAIEFDFLEGDEAYKHTWANGVRQLFSIEILTGSWRAYLYYWWDRARIRLSRSRRLRALNLWLNKRRGKELK